VMVLGPTRRKADVMAEQRTERETRKHDAEAAQAVAAEAVAAEVSPGSADVPTEASDQT